MDDATRLSYTADFKVGGKLAQVGSRLVTGAVKKMTDQFFTNFADQVAPGALAAAAEASSGQAVSGSAADESRGPASNVGWIAAAIVAAITAIVVVLLL